MKQLRFAGIINACATTHDGDEGNIYADATAKQTTICLSKAVDPALVVPIGIPPIPYGGVNSYSYLASAVEVRQDCLVGYVDETIVAATRYGVDVGNFQDKYESHAQNIGKYRFTSAATLSGNAATDRHNVYTALATKINNHLSNHVEAFPVYKVAFTGGTTADIVPGERVLQETSGIYATVAKFVITSGTFGGSDSAGFIYLCDFDDISSWASGSKTLTGQTSTGVVTTAAVLTTGAGLHIRDDASYFVGIGRRGISQVIPAVGFTAALNEVTRAGVYSIGQGTAMLAEYPVFDPTGLNLISGKAENILNAQPLAGTTYRTYVISCKATPPSAESLSGAKIDKDIEIILYVDDGNGTDIGNFETRLATELAK